MIKSFQKLQFLFYSSFFIMEPEPKHRNFFGSGSSQKGRLRNSGYHYLPQHPNVLSDFTLYCISRYLPINKKKILQTKLFNMLLTKMFLAARAVKLFPNSRAILTLNEPFITSYNCSFSTTSIIRLNISTYLIYRVFTVNLAFFH